MSTGSQHENRRDQEFDPCRRKRSVKGVSMFNMVLMTSIEYFQAWARQSPRFHHSLLKHSVMVFMEQRELQMLFCSASSWSALITVIARFVIVSFNDDDVHL